MIVVCSCVQIKIKENGINEKLLYVFGMWTDATSHAYKLLVELP